MYSVGVEVGVGVEVDVGVEVEEHSDLGVVPSTWIDIVESILRIEQLKILSKNEIT